MSVSGTPESDKGFRERVNSCLFAALDALTHSELICIPDLDIANLVDRMTLKNGFPRPRTPRNFHYTHFHDDKFSSKSIYLLLATKRNKKVCI